MAIAGGVASILPITRGPRAGVNTYHRYLIFQTQPLTWVDGAAVPIVSDLRWHNGLDKVYFQLLCLNEAPAIVQINWDIYLRLDNVEDTIPYNSGTQNFPVTSGGAPNYDAQSFPLGGLPMPSSCEYYVRLWFAADPGEGLVMVSLWATPELWYTFRQIEQIAFEPAEGPPG